MWAMNNLHPLRVLHISGIEIKGNNNMSSDWLTDWMCLLQGRTFTSHSCLLMNLNVNPPLEVYMSTNCCPAGSWTSPPADLTSLMTAQFLSKQCDRCLAWVRPLGSQIQSKSAFRCSEYVHNYSLLNRVAGLSEVVLGTSDWSIDLLCWSLSYVCFFLTCGI